MNEMGMNTGAVEQVSNSANHAKLRAIITSGALLLGVAVGCKGITAEDPSTSAGQATEGSLGTTPGTDTLGTDVSTTLIAPNSAEAPTQNKLEQGDHPCGRTITEPELIKQFSENPEVPLTNPVEAIEFMDAHPELKKSMLDFYDTNDPKVIDWIIAHKDKTDPNLVDTDKEGQADRLRAFYNRIQVSQLDSDVVVGNHGCNPETGEIFDAGNRTLQAGDFVYDISFKDDAELESFLKETEISRDKLILKQFKVKLANGEEVTQTAIIVNRGTCDNPLTPPVKLPPATSTTPVIITTSTSEGTTTTEFVTPKSAVVPVEGGASTTVEPINTSTTHGNIPTTSIKATTTTTFPGVTVTTAAPTTTQTPNSSPSTTAVPPSTHTTLR